MGELLSRFFSDDMIVVVLLLAVLDLLMGLIAALRLGKFRLSYIADFARNDLLGKVLPLFLLYGGLVFAEGQDIVIPGFDLRVITYGASAIVIAALVGSVLNSIRDLGLFSLPEEVAGDDPSTPGAPTTSPPA